MLRFLLIVVNLISFSKVYCQPGNRLIEDLRTINSAVVHSPCQGSQTMTISHRAMNIFLADKTAYLSAFGDLSYYTNYVTLSSSSGMLTLNHNFQKASGKDEPTRGLFSLGAKAKIADGFNTSLVDKKFRKNVGITLTQAWLGKVKTTLSGCGEQNKPTDFLNQKQAMDALRMGIVHQLVNDINKKVTDFNDAISAIDSAQEIPGQNIQAARALVQHDFYAELVDEYQLQFARMQAEALTKTNYFKTITTHWTSLIAYVPLAFPKFNIAASYTSPIQQVHPYPFEISLNHTRLWESSKAGRLFITLSAKLAANNSVNAFLTNTSTFTEYKNQGGIDTLLLTFLKNDEINVGSYQNFITPSLHARVVYFSPGSHIGVSFLLEKNFGNDNLLNGRLGIPVILINSKKLPAMNVEFQVSFFDITHQLSADKKQGNNTSIGVGIGIPFSRLMY